MSSQYKLQKIALCLLFFVVAASHSFFLNSKDIRRILQIFPRAFEVEPTHKARPVPYRHRENNHYYPDEYPHDFYDRYDGGEKQKTSIRNSKNRVNEKYPSYHSHEDCDHPDHHQHHKYLEDRVEKEKHHNNRHNKYRDNGETEYYSSQGAKRTHQNKKKMQNEREHQEANYDRVLVSIPKIKNEEELERYYKDSKQKNIFLQQLLKTEGEEEQQLPEEDVKPYYY